MVNKPIIINGVDVSECEFYKTHSNSVVCNSKGSRGYIKDYGLHIHLNCKDNPNCYYKQLKRKEQECERLKWYMQEIRNQELSYLDIEWDEYQTHCIDTEYSNIINLVEEALEERSAEDCRYGK